MRSNLISLQKTADLMDRTQTRLSTGKKINSAIDGPTSFFASKALDSRADTISSLKDAMGQAIQTINAADKGIKAIQSLIEQAKGIARAALSTGTSGSAAATGTITVSGLSVATSYDVGTVSLTNIADHDFIGLNTGSYGTAHRAYLSPSPANYWEFQLVSGDMNASAANMATEINNWHWSDYADTYYYTARNVNGTNTLYITKHLTADGSVVNFTSSDIDTNPGSSNTGMFGLTTGPIPADKVQVGGVTFTATTGSTSGQNFNISGDDTADMTALANVINGYSWGSTAYSASVTNGRLVLSKTVNGNASDVTSSDYSVSGVTNGSASVSLVTSSSELTSLQNQYNVVRDQLTAVATDSIYQGKDLLAASNNMTIKFEGTSLTVNSFDASASGLGITAATWTTGGSIDGDLNLLDNALSTLLKESSRIASNLSIITVRQDFTTEMVNTLSTGSSKLTLADTNEEGASMLMLQTRQSLSISALSLSSQSNQAVLKLFG
jgi:flagellin